VPGDEQGRGFNRQAQRWAALFWEGDADYQTDEKWYEAVIQAEGTHTKKGVAVPADLTGGDAFPEGDQASGPTAEDYERQEEEPDAGAAAAAPAQAERADDPVLSGVYELMDLPGAPRLEVTAERVTKGMLPGRRPIEFGAVASRVEFAYDPRHPLFTNSLLDPVDCLIEELAYQLLFRSRTTQAQNPLSSVAHALREKYFSSTLSNYEALRDEAGALLDEMIEFFTEALAPLAGQHAETLTSEEHNAIAQAVARIDHQGEERVQEVIERGEYPRYLGAPCLPKLVDTWPELILDGSFLSVSFGDVDEAAREHVLRDVVTPLRDVIWLANPDGMQVGGLEWRTLLARARANLRLLEAWKVLT
jgi:hypothetical protein